MNILLTGGGMKLSYQVGQAHALVMHGVCPSTIYCVSSGIVVAALIAHAMHSGQSLRANYENLLANHATRGQLPKLSQSRKLVAAYIEAECIAPSDDGPQIIAVGARRGSYQPLLFNLRVCHRAEVLEALMSIPFVADSAASKSLQIVDGGFDRNAPYHLMPEFAPSLVLSHFQPKVSHPDCYGGLPGVGRLSRGPLLHGYRLLWAYINTTFPHASDLSIANWIYPRFGSGLNFFSRSLEQHLRAIRQGVEDTEIWLASRRLLQHDAATTLCLEAS